MISQAAHRWLIRTSLALLGCGTLAVGGGMALGAPWLSGIGIMMFIGGATAFGLSLFERVACQVLGRPTAFDPAYAIIAPPRKGCHACGYAMHGVPGVFCPECGVVRASDSTASTNSRRSTPPPDEPTA